MPHRLDHVIDQLLKEDADRALARAWGAKLDRDGVGERSEAPLREAARIAQPHRLIEHALGISGEKP
jgi:hypothetical protein